MIHNLSVSSIGSSKCFYSHSDGVPYSTFVPSDTGLMVEYAGE